MMGRIVELTQRGLFIRKYRGFLVVSRKKKEIGRIPLDDIDAVLSSTTGCTWTDEAFSALAARQVPVVFCDNYYLPVSVVLPLTGYYAQANRFRLQMQVSAPFRKRAWQVIVRHKIMAQAHALVSIGESPGRLCRLAKEVRVADSTNREGLAAQYYWPIIMGKSFRRGREDETNALLNYGYTVLRAATARAIVCAGLHPSCPLHHRSDGNAWALADDLMEPFRPTIDLAVVGLIKENGGIPPPVGSCKAVLVDVLSRLLTYETGLIPLSQGIFRLVQSLVDSMVSGKVGLFFPAVPVSQGPRQEGNEYE